MELQLDGNAIATLFPTESKDAIIAIHFEARIICNSLPSSGHPFNELLQRKTLSPSKTLQCKLLATQR
eukprot:3255354-Amphidinium_carterae.1